MQGDIIDQGLELMLFGMGTVVVFLTLLIFATTGMSWLLGRYFPEAELPTSNEGPTLAQPVPAADQSLLVAIITAAIHQHRNSKK
ncbi:MAG: OadG family protein [Halioglobus sp.]